MVGQGPAFPKPLSGKKKKNGFFGSGWVDSMKNYKRRYPVAYKGYVLIGKPGGGVGCKEILKKEEIAK